MSPKKFNSLILLCFKGRFFFLLLSLLGMIVLAPLLQNFFRLRILLDIFLMAVFVSSIYAVSNQKNLSVMAGLSALPMFISRWVAYFVTIPSLTLAGDICGILFMTFLIFAILSFVFREREVNANVIYASIVTYLLLAVMWAFIFSVIESMQPGSFSLPLEMSGKNTTLYYSFVTITTLGYGDITPASDIARAFSMLEAVIGQIYLVILVARLVGINIAQEMDKNRNQ